MLTGVVFAIYLTPLQKILINQWLGCYRFIWNAKCEEDIYLTKFANKFLPLGTFPSIDQSFSQYKNKELSPWLLNCPSQLLRNSVSNWFYTYKQYLKKVCNKPKRKRKTNRSSMHLTKELFRFEKCFNSSIKLFIGTKKFPIGYISIKIHKKFKEPNSIYLKRVNDRYAISFCYEDDIKETTSQKDYFTYLQTLPKSELNATTIGIDRGIIRPVQAGDDVYDFTKEQKKKKKAKEKYIKRCQKRLSKQKKGSKRRQHTKKKLSKAYEDINNIRNDFCHKTSRSIVDNPNIKIFVLEHLSTKNMTKKSKPKIDDKTGKYIKNNKKQKSGLNRSILDKCWHKLETYIKYKSVKANKIWFFINPKFTSQECADCGHIHPDNRKGQKFCCLRCGHIDNADHNSAMVIKKRAINLLIYSGTELSSKGVLLDIERGAINKTQEAKANCAQSKEMLKKKGKVTTSCLSTGSSLL